MAKTRILSVATLVLLIGPLTPSSARADSIFNPNPWNTPGNPPGPNARGCYHLPVLGLPSYIYTYRDWRAYTYAPERHPGVPRSFKVFQSPCAAVNPAELYEAPQSTPSSQPRK